MAHGFVARRDDGEKIWLHATPDRAAKHRVRDARWGDFLNIVGQSADGWTEIKWGSKRYFLLTENVAQARPLEIVFVDVGQGDGCIVVSPETGDDERILVVDAGESSHMMGMLRWRFGKLLRRFDFHAAVITHPDKDHYQGFSPVFKHQNVFFDRVYHNGLAERAGADLLGPSSGRLLTGLAQTFAQLKAIYPEDGPHSGKMYCKLMRAAIEGRRVGRIEMLSTRHGTQEDGRAWMPGFAPSDGRDLSIEVLGPVPDDGPGGKPALRWFGRDIGSNGRDEGKTKNGHSVLLRLNIGGLRVLLGGDLNRPAEDYLLRHYSGIAADAPLADAVPLASQRLGADVLKCCHHGAADVTDQFLQAVNPFAFVVSSGDEESHAHPRPDLLGRLGKQGRGSAPLILCTEILRSTREQGRKEDFDAVAALNLLIEDPDIEEDERRQARKDRSELLERIRKRNVGVYGAITLRSDGAHMQISFQLESPRGKQRWQVYGLHQDADGRWVMASDGH